MGKVTASLFLSDLTDEGVILQLISPNGTTVILAENNGALGANFGTACSPTADRTTFDDVAPQSVLSGVAPFVGTFSPIQPLSTFNLLSGTNANGTWQLNVINQLGGNTCTLECWSLSISPEECTDGGGQCPGSDLSLTMTANSLATTVGGNLVYTLSVSNVGPSSAENFTVVHNLPTIGLRHLASTTSPRDTLTKSGSALTIDLGSMPALGSATITVDAFPTQTGLLTSTASWVSQEPIPNPNNNNASVSVLVTKPTADQIGGEHDRNALFRSP